MNFKAIALCAAIAGALAGCSSSVKLQEADVADLGTSARTAPPAGYQERMCADGNFSTCGEQGVATVTPIKSGIDAERGPDAITHTIQFEFDSFEVAPQYHGALQAHAQYMRNNKSATVFLEGHADERGSREYNLALGQKRAEAVQRAMSILGADTQRIESVSYGEEKPVAIGADEASWAQNRRAEIRYRK